MGQLSYINNLGYTTIGNEWGYMTNKALAKHDLLMNLNIDSGEADWDPKLGTTIKKKMFDKKTESNLNEILSEIKRVFEEDLRFDLISIDTTELNKGWIFNTVISYLGGTPEEWVFSVDRKGKASVGNYPLKG